MLILGVLFDAGFNFCVNEILNNWPNGAQFISQLGNMITQGQNLVNTKLNANKTIKDFKVKLLRIHQTMADEVGKAEAQTRQYLDSNTFTNMSSSFTAMGA